MLDSKTRWINTDLGIHLAGLYSSEMRCFNETIFITGFPGFIAGRLVERLAREGARFTLLVQPALLKRAYEDVAQIVAETGAPAENFSIVEGDITKSDLGLTQTDLERARAETHTVFHLAAAYDLAVAQKWDNSSTFRARTT